LNHRWHVLNGENETAQHEKGKDEKKGGHHGLLLCGRDGAYK